MQQPGVLWPELSYSKWRDTAATLQLPVMPCFRGGRVKRERRHSRPRVSAPRYALFTATAKLTCRQT
jgi:hypothetical protein